MSLHVGGVVETTASPAGQSSQRLCPNNKSCDSQTRVSTNTPDITRAYGTTDGRLASAPQVAVITLLHFSRKELLFAHP